MADYGWVFAELTSSFGPVLENNKMQYNQKRRINPKDEGQG